MLLCVSLLLPLLLLGSAADASACGADTGTMHCAWPANCWQKRRHQRVGAAFHLLCICFWGLAGPGPAACGVATINTRLWAEMVWHTPQLVKKTTFNSNALLLAALSVYTPNPRSRGAAVPLCSSPHRQQRHQPKAQQQRRHLGQPVPIRVLQFLWDHLVESNIQERPGRQGRHGSRHGPVAQHAAGVTDPDAQRRRSRKQTHDQPKLGVGGLQQPAHNTDSSGAAV